MPGIAAQSSQLVSGYGGVRHVSVRGRIRASASVEVFSVRSVPISQGLPWFLTLATRWSSCEQFKMHSRTSQYTSSGAALPRSYVKEMHSLRGFVADLCCKLKSGPTRPRYPLTDQGVIRQPANEWGLNRRPATLLPGHCGPKDHRNGVREKAVTFLGCGR